VLVSLGWRDAGQFSIALLDRSLRAQLVDRAPGSAPAFFFIDIQTDQGRALRAARGGAGRDRARRA
jgi:predicted lysophospholipase L1 biosynthesis ABC-type transport system permease subunit